MHLTAIDVCKEAASSQLHIEQHCLQGDEEAAPGLKEMAQNHGVNVAEVRPLTQQLPSLSCLPPRRAAAAAPGHMLRIMQHLCLGPMPWPQQAQLKTASHDSSPHRTLSQPFLLQWLLSNWTAAMLGMAYENLSQHKDLSRCQEHLRWQAILNLLISLQRELPGVRLAVAILWG